MVLVERREFIEKEEIKWKSERERNIEKIDEWILENMIV